MTKGIERGAERERDLRASLRGLGWPRGLCYSLALYRFHLINRHSNFARRYPLSQLQVRKPRLKEMK